MRKRRKQIRCVGLMLLLSGIFSFSSFAKSHEYLYVVYVTNRDRDPLPDYEARMSRIMLDIQDFFRSEMKRNGYGAKVFPLQLDKRKQVVVHLITLDSDFDPGVEFSPNNLLPVIDDYFKKKGIDIDHEAIITFINAYWGSEKIWDFNSCYTGRGNAANGSTWIVDHEVLDIKNIDPKQTRRINDRGRKSTIAQFNVKMIGGAAHELGHGLGLPHNGETPEEFKKYGKALMGAGNYTYRQERLGKKKHGAFLTPAHAFCLSLHPLFRIQPPKNFDTPNVSFDPLVFKEKGEIFGVKGKVTPFPQLAGVVAFQDPYPAGINKDYDAYSYVAKLVDGKEFKMIMPVPPKTDACELRFRIYSKNGMYRRLDFTQAQEDGLTTLQNDYLWHQVEFAYRSNDPAQLKKLAPKVRKTIPERAAAAENFYKAVKRLKNAQIPAKVAPGKHRILLSSTLWHSADVGWNLPCANGIIDKNGKSFTSLISSEGECSSGLFAHANSSYIYNLGGKWETLTTRFGLQAGHAKGSVVFIVKTDNKEVFRSEPTTLADGEQSTEIDLDGIRKLELITEKNGVSSADAWGIWIAPSLRR